MRFTDISSSVVFASRFFDLSPRVAAVATQSRNFVKLEPEVTTELKVSGPSWDCRLVRGSVACVLVMFNIVLVAYMFPAAQQIAEMSGVPLLESIWIGFVSTALGLPVIAAANLLIMGLMKRNKTKLALSEFGCRS